MRPFRPVLVSFFWHEGGAVQFVSTTDGRAVRRGTLISGDLDRCCERVAGTFAAALADRVRAGIEGGCR